MAEDRPVHEALLDCLVYAPLGAVIVALEEMPRLAELGRESVDKQVAIARLIGRFTVAEGRRRFAPPQARAPRRESPPKPPASRAESPTTEVETAARPPEEAPQAQSADVVEAVEVESSSGTAESAGPPTTATSRPGHDLPIPAYDTLAASQVVERLASLTPDELEAVRKHEAATRRRRTVLHRIAQLNAEHDGATA